MLRTTFPKPALPRRKSPLRSCRLGIEKLEDRQVLSANFGPGFEIGPGTRGWNVAKDTQGNTLVLGSMYDSYATVDVDPGPATVPFSGVTDGTGNFFVAKYDSDGNFVWITRLGGGVANFGPKLATGSDGAVYVTGSFTSSAIFGSTTLTGVGGRDPFVTKLDASGNILWAQRLNSGTGDDFGNSVAVDGTGNAYVIGEVSGSKMDAFITKLDAAGTVSWTKQFGNSTAAPSGGWARGYEITVDGAGNVYATGRLGGTVDLVPGAGVYNLTGDGFVMKMTTGGNIVWAKDSGFTEPRGIGVDASGNVYTAGTFDGTRDFDPGKGKTTLTAMGGYDVYAAKLDVNGNFAWAKRAGGSAGYDMGRALALDAAANVYVTGYFTGKADFDPSSGTFNLTSAGATDVFVWKLNTNGGLVWATGMGSATADVEESLGITVDPAGIVYTIGASYTYIRNASGAVTGSTVVLFLSEIVQSAPMSMALATAPQTSTAAANEMSNPVASPANSRASTLQLMAPTPLMMATNPLAKNRLIDRVLEGTAGHWLEYSFTDELL